MLDDFKFQLNKIDNIFFRMIDNMEEFLLEYIQLSRLIPTLFSSSSSSELKIQFNNRVNKNIEEDINQCISNLCDWLVERSNRTVYQLNKHLNSSTINSRQLIKNTNEVETDFSISRQQILNQLQTQCQNVNQYFIYSVVKMFFLRFFTNKKQRPVLMQMNFLHPFVRQC
jgi:t-SNARE complex subunit (syntaxin)